MFFFALIFCNFLALGYGQRLGSTEYCTDLIPQTNLTINKMLGTWFGAEVITHKDRVTGERSSKDCIYIVLTEISHGMATARPPENPREIVTQFGKTSASNPMKDYRFLRLEWTELDEKIEYILRFNISRNGFWLSSAPHERSHYGEQPSFSAFTGIVQVIAVADNYLLLTFCETVPHKELFSIILTRHLNSLPIDVSTNTENKIRIFEKLRKIIRGLHEKLRVRNLPNIAYRRVCDSGVDSIHGSCILGIVVALVFSIQSKYM